MVSLKQLAVLATQFVATLALDVKVKSSGGNATSGAQYGFLHEDINNSGDGGIYAELIYNRAFQYSDLYPVSLDGYRAINSDLKLRNLSDPLSSALPVSMNVAPEHGYGRDHSSEAVGFLNEGYWGMDVQRQKYTGSFWVRGEYHGVFTAELCSNLTGEVFGRVDVPSKASKSAWTEHEFELVPWKDAPNSNNTFALTFDPQGAKDGSLDFNLISLFPPTYKGRKNGLRIDIAEALAGFARRIRFPGGNMLEGNTNKTWWDWRNSIGPLKDRPGFSGVWGYEQTNGLGLMEYLYWAEDMGLESTLAVWDGLALNADITPEDKLQPYIDAALEEIEFITGPAESKWGSVRASLGHPEPFPLHYVEIGNEDWLAGGTPGWDSYLDYRFPLFYKAIHSKYPDLTIVASGASSNGFTNPPPGVLGDYHPYLEPDELVTDFDRFDNDYGHMVGEVAAVHPNGGVAWDGNLMPYPWWIGSVGEAVSLIGYERNAARVPGALYAPVLRNMNRWQWSVTIVQFAADPRLTTRSTSWHVWALLSRHQLAETLPATEDFGPAYYVAGRSAGRGSLVWKGAVYNTTDGADEHVSVAFEGVREGAAAAVTLLTNKERNPYADNDPFTGVDVVDTKTFLVKAGKDGAFEFSMPELSVAVLDTDHETWYKRDERGVAQPFQA